MISLLVLSGWMSFGTIFCSAGWKVCNGRPLEVFMLFRWLNFVSLIIIYFQISSLRVLYLNSARRNLMLHFWTGHISPTNQYLLTPTNTKKLIQTSLFNFFYSAILSFTLSPAGLPNWEHCLPCLTNEHVKTISFANLQPAHLARTAGGQFNTVLD